MTCYGGLELSTWSCGQSGGMQHMCKMQLAGPTQLAALLWSW